MNTNRSGKYVKFSIYLVIIVLLNIVGSTLFTRVDLTDNRIYSLSDASKEVVSTLSEPLTIKVFFTKNLPAPYNNTEQYLQDLLEEYAIYAGKRNNYFNYQFYNVSPDSDNGAEAGLENREMAKNYGITPVQIRVVEQDEIKFKNAYMGLVMIHGDIIEKIPTIPSTEGLEYQLTTAIKKMNNKISTLLALKQNIQIDFYLSSSMKQVAPLMGLKELPELPDRVKKAVDKLNAKSYGKLTYTFLDPSQDPQLKEEAGKHDLMRLKWPAVPRHNIQAGSGVIGLIMRYGKKSMGVQLLNMFQLPLIGTRYELVDMDDLETIINENIETLIDINENIGYLADHGTQSLFGSPRMNPMAGGQTEGLTNFQSLVAQNYSFKQINLKEETIPDSLNCLVIAGPTEKFTDYELYQIDQFLMKGKSLAVLTDAFKEVMPQNRQRFAFGQGPSYVPLKTGLEKLLEHYGVMMKRSYVLDENCFKQAGSRQFGSGETPIYFAPIIDQKNINNSLPFMKNIKGLVAFRVSPLSLIQDKLKEGKISAVKLLSSSEKSWEMKGRINLDPRFIRPPASRDDQESYALAYMLEGQFSSYFKGKPIPEKPVEKEKEKDTDNKKIGPTENKAEKPEIDPADVENSAKPIATGKPAKIFIMASSEMVKNSILDRDGKGPNATFILNTLDYLNGRTDIAVMRSKEQRLNPLFETTALEKSVIKTFNIAGLPILVVLFGLLVWWRRHARKKQIQMIFQNIG